MRRGLLILGIYLVVGLVVAIAKGYFNNVGEVGDVIDILVAIVLWPLILFGVEINIGGVDGGGNGGGGNGGGGGGGGGGS
jgi:hypothetical protein